MEKVKQYPGVFDFKKKRGETAQNYESRMKETGGKSNWTPTDGRGVRTDTGKGGGRFPATRKPFPG